MATHQEIADAVVRRAQRQGFVIPRDIRGEVKLAGLPESAWKEVLDLVKPALNYRQGRYYHPSSALSPRLQKEQEQQRVIEKSIQKLIREHKIKHKDHERRKQVRIDYVQPVIIHTEDGKQFTLLSRDLSATGIRLVGTRRLLGQKIRVELPGNPPIQVVTRILWTGALGEDLFENGGNFLEIAQGI